MGYMLGNNTGQEDVVMGTKRMIPLVFLLLQSLPLLNQKVLSTPLVRKSPWSVLVPEIHLNTAWDSMS